MTGVTHARKRPKTGSRARVGKLAKESLDLSCFMRTLTYYFSSQRLSTKALALSLLRNGEVLRAPRAHQRRMDGTEPQRRPTGTRTSLVRGPVLT
jgi:hypothetical protein